MLARREPRARAAASAVDRLAARLHASTITKGGSLMAIRKRGKGRWQVRVRPFPEMTVPTREAARDGRARPEAAREARAPVPREAGHARRTSSTATSHERQAMGGRRGPLRPKSIAFLSSPRGPGSRSATRPDPQPPPGDGRGPHRRASGRRAGRRGERARAAQGGLRAAAVARPVGRPRHLRDRTRSAHEPRKASRSSSRNCTRSRRRCPSGSSGSCRSAAPSASASPRR